MGLLFSGDHSFSRFGPAEWRPNGFDIDQLIVPYRGSIENLDAFFDALTIWGESDIDDNMYLSAFPSDGHLQFPTVRLTFLGKKGGNLPPGKHDSEDSVLSATSSRASNGVMITSPLTVEYYGPTNVVSYISRGGPGGNIAADPPPVSEVICATTQDATFDGGVVIDDWLPLFFSQRIVHSLKSEEIVAAQYWRNTSRKTSTLFPFIFDLEPGAYMQLSAPGTGYGLGQTVYVAADGKSASANITALGLSNSILNFTQVSNSFTTPQSSLGASGGSGSGARFNIFIIT